MRPAHRPLAAPLRRSLVLLLVPLLAACGHVAAHPARAGAGGGPPVTDPAPGSRYPLHTSVVSTTFWVGEVLDPGASDGSQVVSTYDSLWEAHYGGCDGVVVDGRCTTEARTAANGYFPTAVAPHENPFYLDLPFDDVHDRTALAERGRVVPWAADPGYAGHVTDPTVSLLKNRWVALGRAGHTCFAQVEDAGPAQYHDATYVFGTDDARPASQEFHGAGLDVSPAVNGCLAYSELDGQDDTVSWRFVDAADVPPGPWTRVVTSSGVTG